MNLNGVEYYYVRNGQGDVIALVDGQGNEVVTYTYDSWGNIISIDGSLATTVGVKNPYRYRGYRYDEETKLYYLKSRYYNPEWGRFVNADAIVGNDGELLSHNMFAYCSNDPVNMEDKNVYFGIKSSINKLNHAFLYVCTFVISRMYVIQQRINSKVLRYIDKVFNKGAGKTFDKLGSDALKKIGVPAENSGIRAVTGNADDAYKFFKAQVNPDTIKEVKQGTFVGKDYKGLTFTYRASSKSGPPTIDINGVSGLRKIKFIDGGAAK